MTPRFRRIIACAVAPFALFAAAPASAPPGWPAGDHVTALAGPWACRTVEGVIVHATGTLVGDEITVHNVVERAGKQSSFDDHYVFDPALGRWHVQTALGGFGGGAAPWTGESWTIQGENRDGVAVRMTDELLPGGDFRRTFAYDNQGAEWFSYSVERCTPGTTPPAADACIAKRYPPTTLDAGPQISITPPNLPSGTVYVVVSLDTASRIVAARVQSSSAPELNLPALAEARRTKFRTAIIDCKPVAADYIFGVSF
ncbi:MAG TPA: hypothetical protein VGU66_13160 [Candidatus Elarobacter sp.]|nr:hypothetical protein [Candidatus Elarobacter sp.]